MKIFVHQAAKVKIRFEGKINMSQEVVLDKKDAQNRERYLKFGGKAKNDLKSQIQFSLTNCP